MKFGHNTMILFDDDYFHFEKPCADQNFKGKWNKQFSFVIPPECKFKLEWRKGLFFSRYLGKWFFLIYRTAKKNFFFRESNFVESFEMQRVKILQARFGKILFNGWSDSEYKILWHALVRKIWALQKTVSN